MDGYKIHVIQANTAYNDNKYSSLYSRYVSASSTKASCFVSAKRHTALIADTVENILCFDSLESIKETQAPIINDLPHPSPIHLQTSRLGNPKHIFQVIPAILYLPEVCSLSNDS